MQKLLWTSQRDAQLPTPSLSLYQWDLKSGMVLEVSVTKTHGGPGAVSCQPLVLVCAFLRLRAQELCLSDGSREGGIQGAEAPFAHVPRNSSFEFELLNTVGHPGVCFLPCVVSLFFSRVSALCLH